VGCAGKTVRSLETRPIPECRGGVLRQGATQIHVYLTLPYMCLLTVVGISNDELHCVAGHLLLLVLRMKHVASLHSMDTYVCFGRL